MKKSKNLKQEKMRSGGGDLHRSSLPADLSHPKNSIEFLQHMLCQTKKVDNLKRNLKRISICLAVVSILLLFTNIAAYLSSNTDIKGSGDPEGF